MKSDFEAMSSSDPRQRLEQAEAFCQVIRALHQRGWCEGTGGNFSMVLSTSPLSLLMAPSGVDKGLLRAADLLVVDAEGHVREGLGKASAETLLHLAIVETTQAGAVLHTHSQSATLLSRLEGCRSPAESAQTEAAQGRQQPQVVLGLENQHGNPGGTPADKSFLGYLHISGLEMLKGLEGIHSHTNSIALPILANSQDMVALSQSARPYQIGRAHV